MSNFVIAAGHTASGNIGCGVVAYLDESKCTREISQLVGKELERKGHKVNFLIIDKSNSYNCEDCFVRTKMANELNEKEKVDLYVEIHINAGGGTGTEVL
ncbi:N-acetylmuramoyl-L-alanine amidase, partial [Clostridium butyricum]